MSDHSPAGRYARGVAIYEAGWAACWLTFAALLWRLSATGGLGGEGLLGAGAARALVTLVACGAVFRGVRRGGRAANLGLAVGAVEEVRGAVGAFDPERILYRAGGHGYESYLLVLGPCAALIQTVPAGRWTLRGLVTGEDPGQTILPDELWSQAEYLSFIFGVEVTPVICVAGGNLDEPFEAVGTTVCDVESLRTVLRRLPAVTFGSTTALGQENTASDATEPEYDLVFEPDPDGETGLAFSPDVEVPLGDPVGAGTADRTEG